MQLIPEITDFAPTLKTWRRDLHRQPETAFEERRTAAFIAEQLRSWGLNVFEGIGRTGVVGLLEGSRPGGMVGLRADMDAIPLRESNAFDHASTVAGKMHGCGHDGHVCMLLGAAWYLARHRDFAGRICFIFQPAEENEGGGRAMVEEGLFERFPVDMVFGLHNWPGLIAGQFGIIKGPIMAGDDRFEIVIRGKGCHAAMPHLGIDPIPILARLVSAMQTIVSRSLDPQDPAVVSVTQVQAGDTWNVIPDRAMLRGTLRHFRPEVQDLVEARIRALATGIAQGAGAEAEVNYMRCYPPTVNNPEATDVAVRAAVRVAGQDNVLTRLPPSMGAEDFSYLLLRKPGCYAWIGGGEPERNCVLHSPYYDFNDRILPIGATYWVRLAEEFLAAKA